MKTAKDIYIMIRRSCCFASCKRWQSVQAFTHPCCFMAIMAEEMLLRGEY